MPMRESVTLSPSVAYVGTITILTADPLDVVPVATYDRALLADAALNESARLPGIAPAAAAADIAHAFARAPATTSSAKEPASARVTVMLVRKAALTF